MKAIKFREIHSNLYSVLRTSGTYSARKKIQFLNSKITGFFSLVKTVSTRNEWMSFGTEFSQQRQGQYGKGGRKDAKMNPGIDGKSFRPRLLIFEIRDSMTV